MSDPTTDVDLRAYLDAHGTDGPIPGDAPEGYYMVELMPGGSGRGLIVPAFKPGGARWPAAVWFDDDDPPVQRHAPLRLAAPDLPCGHPAGCVRPTEGHAGTTRWCGWCEAEGDRNAALVRAERAERERDAAEAGLIECRSEAASLRAEVARLTEAAAVASIADRVRRGEVTPRPLAELAAAATERVAEVPEPDRELRWAHELLGLLGPEPGGDDEEGGR